MSTHQPYPYFVDGTNQYLYSEDGTSHSAGQPYGLPTDYTLGMDMSSMTNGALAGYYSSQAPAPTHDYTNGMGVDPHDLGPGPVSVPMPDPGMGVGGIYRGHGIVYTPPPFSVYPGVYHGNGNGSGSSSGGGFPNGNGSGHGQYLSHQLPSASGGGYQRHLTPASTSSQPVTPDQYSGTSIYINRDYSHTPERQINALQEQGSANSTTSASGNGEKEPNSGKWKADGKEKDKDKEGPVKAACLNCRQKKAKCDGVQPICGQCSKKQLDCVFVKSKRGGARKKREVVPPSALQEFLKKMDILVSVHDTALSPGVSEPSDDATHIVRQFSSRHEIFRCYYNEVHPFLPVMPPRKYLDEILPTLLAESPFLLAAETIMVLVPHPLDPNPKSANSKRLRTAASFALGKRTRELVEHLILTENSIECVQALTMLSMWEWGNAADLKQNGARAAEAIQAAMDLGVHELDKDKDASNEHRALEGEDWRKDMARRTWWSAYGGQITAAMMSGNTPSILPDDPRVQIDFPVCSMSDVAWPNWINTMRHCVRVFNIVNTLYYSKLQESVAWGGVQTDELSPQEQMKMRKQVLEIDAEIMELMRQAELTSVIDLVPGGEEEVARNQQLSARLGLAVTHIHIHRQQAFPEVSLFSKRMCGLPKAPDFAPQPALEDVPVNGGGNFNSMNDLPTLEYPSANGIANGLEVTLAGDDYDITDDMWQPETYPELLPAPWFTHSGGAAALWQPTDQFPTHIPALTASIMPVSPTSAGMNEEEQRRASTNASSIKGTPKSLKPPRAWGVDKDDNVAIAPMPEVGADGVMQVFPPGISLARCATAAHTIVRLEVLHRSAVIALWDGPPKWLPFCSCGLVTGAYAFLLLALAVQAENEFATGDEALKKAEEVEALLTNVRVILAGLEAYGVMWAGIDVMAGEVRAALEAASKLPFEIKAQIESASVSPPNNIQRGSLSST